MKKREWVLGPAVFAAWIGAAHAQQSPGETVLPPIDVSAPAPGTARYFTDSAAMGALGTQAIQDIPASVTVVPQGLLLNQQVATVNDALRYLPSVTIRNQQGYEVSRPQSRGFQGSIVQNTRLDGFNVIGTTAIPAENLQDIQVLNGMAGSLYGPQTPAGTFNYVSKRPTDQPLFRFTEGDDSTSVFTEALDVGGRVGPDGIRPDGAIGYRFNLVHGEGSSWAPDSRSNRTLLSAALDFHLDRQTVVETSFSHYQTNITGLPGSITYDSGKSTFLPAAVDPTRLGYGQPGAGTDLITNTASIKLKHDIDDQWNVEVGLLYQNADRGLYGITNALTDNTGRYTVTKNFNAVPHFAIASDTASLNGHFSVLGMMNDFTLGTNGFDNAQYSSRNPIATVLGSASLANPAVFAAPPVPNNGGQYRSATLTEQTIVLGDTLHLNPRWAIQGVLNSTFIDQRSFDAKGRETGGNAQAGALSPTLSVIYRPTQALTTYATFTSALEQGDQAPAGTANANQFMTPYRDHEYEIGAKYAPNPDFLISADAFWMTRPLGATNAATNVFSVIGSQRDIGAELFVQGELTHDLSLFGGVTYVDATLNHTGNPATDGGMVVGVPRFKGDLAADYHPAFADGVAFTGAVHVESKRAATNTNNSFAAGYATFDLGLRYSNAFFGHRETFRFQVVNLTDKRYYASVADGNIVGSPGANTAYLGTPRTFMASLELDY
ncbi:TonB-dependent receptor [Burkholderia paludis]|uniref:TonB-dependent receptor n=1 Tax=Burkholderia paludis TaxID=1506587 RepID=UPI0013768B71|nr:TonB-dependent receptor [Burkholderia paludis]